MAVGTKSTIVGILVGIVMGGALVTLLSPTLSPSIHSAPAVPSYPQADQRNPRQLKEKKEVTPTSSDTFELPARKEPKKLKHLTFSQKVKQLHWRKKNKYSVLLHPYFATQAPYYPDEKTILSKYLPFPKMKPLKDILDAWPTNQTKIPAGFNPDGSLERLDFQDPKDLKRAALLRLHEVPFKVYNVPMLEETKQKWASDEYLIERFGKEPISVTTAKSNQFHYYSVKQRDQAKSFEAPTKKQRMDFQDFLSTMYEAENQPLNSKHYYYQMSTIQSSRHKWIYDDLEGWVPQHNFWMVDPDANRGINCRFGARGISASNHYDAGRNFITILRGAKRYIISPPSYCSDMHLAPKHHPEARHSVNDWTNMDYERFPRFRKVKAIDIVLSAGEALYLPGYWFHHIISLGFNIQCNTRSGLSLREVEYIRHCKTDSSITLPPPK